MGKLKYIPLGLCTLYSLKLLVLGASWTETAILLGLSALAFSYEKFSQDQKIVQLKKEIETQDSKIEEQNKKIESIITSMGSIKTAISLKTQNLSQAR